MAAPMFLKIKRFIARTDTILPVIREITLIKNIILESNQE
jgi:hypothetical protein